MVTFLWTFVDGSSYIVCSLYKRNSKKKKKLYTQTRNIYSNFFLKFTKQEIYNRIEKTEMDY